jgi:4-amino-4-deoxy-L-arabinose transferase-like glycosyltransferase
MKLHEIFVAGTVQEMHARGDWIVPYFNAEPRLNKPPLSYWVTGAVAQLTGSPSRVRPWQARLPSALAGVGLLVLSVWLGRVLFDRATGVLCALLLATSVGYFTYTHNARPDMLYAFWCVAGLACLASTWRSSPASRGRFTPYGAWLCFALATLAKGPHIPAVFLVGFVVFLVAQRVDLREGLAMLRPITGVALLLLLTLPWWWLVHHRLGAETLAGSQLSGSLLTLSWPDALDPYYLYKPLGLLLPWWPLVPGAVLLVCSRIHPWGQAARLLALLVFVTIVVLTIGSQKRVVYVLPLMVPVCLLLAAGCRVLLERGGSTRWWLALPVINGLLVLFGLYWSVRGGGRTETASALWWSALGLTIALLVAATAAGSLRRLPIAQVAISAVMAATFFVSAGSVLAMRSGDRTAWPRLAEGLATRTSEQTKVATLDMPAAVFVYHMRRPVPELQGLGEVRRYREQAGDEETWLILRSDGLEALRESFDAEIVDQAPGERNDALSVVRLRPAGPRDRRK